MSQTYIKTHVRLHTLPALIFFTCFLANTILLAQDGTNLYGVTSAGGTENKGVIFHIDRITGIQIVDLSFSSSQGSNPMGSLTLKGEKFYGMTMYGGANNMGVIFEWNPSTSVYTKKIDFDGTLKGKRPSGDLTFYNGKFYGMTCDGGLYNMGVIFEWDPNTNVFTKKIDFDGVLKGESPNGSLALWNGKLYGMTSMGGISTWGVLFEWDPNTNMFIKKIDFNQLTACRPGGSLTLLNGKFYGTAEGEYFDNLGTIFEWDPNTNILIIKVNFDGTNKGKNPVCTLTLSNGKFFGTTLYGGTNDKGVLFEWDPFTNFYSKKVDFGDTAKGSNPLSTLSISNGVLYGMTYSGGPNNLGVVYNWDPAANNYTKILNFNISNGSKPGYTKFAVYNDSTTAAQASTPFATNVEADQMTINWIDGNGEKRAVFIKQGSDGTAAPANNATYVADTVFGSGIQIGSTGWYCIFNGTIHNSGVTVSNLLPNTIYRVMVCEYNGSTGLEQYNINSSEGNPFNQSTTGYSYTISTVSFPVDGGITNGSGTYFYGNQATVTATPNTGWSFVNWTENGNVVSTSSAYLFIVTFSRNLMANFALQQFTVTTSSNPVEGGSTISGGTFFYGNQITVTATPNTGWNFANWTENGNVVSSNPDYSFTISGNTDLIANFVLQQFNIVTNSNPGSGGTTNGGGTYNYGVQATLNATANSSWVFLNWTENGNVVSTNTQYNFTVIENRSLAANFTQLPTYMITTASFPMTGGVTTGGGNYISGETASVSATPNQGYNFTNWSENGIIVSGNPTYSFTVNVNRNLLANFEPQIFTINTTSVPVEGGTTSGGGSYPYGTSITLIAIANGGWEFDHWSENGNTVSTSSSYSFIVNSNSDLSAIFYQPGVLYSITAVANPVEGGNTTGGGIFTAGSQVTMAATANSDWEFLNWTESGAQVCTDPSYTFTATANRELTANFIQIYTINSSANPIYAGYTTGGGSYTSGQSVTLQAIPNQGWVFHQWTENGISVCGTSGYSFTASGNRNITADFISTVGVSKLNERKISIYPNPAREKVNIEWVIDKQQLFDEVNLFNTYSQLVYHEAVGNISNKLSISLDSFTPGVYYLELRFEYQKIEVFKIIIQP